MDSDDWDDLGDAVLDLGEPSTGWGLALAALCVVIAIVCFCAASSSRQDENTKCNDRCAPHAGTVVRTPEDVNWKCMCKWEDGSLHTPTKTD